MKILRSIHRRDFSVEPAGYFNVLRPSNRFTPAHPPGEFRYLTANPRERRFGSSHENPTTAPTFGLSSVPDQNDLDYRRLLRPALIVSAAITLTLFLVWWSTGCPIHITLWVPQQ